MCSGYEKKVMSNLFVVNTPLQVLTAFIIANSYCKGSNNHLLFINRNYDTLSRDCYYLHQMLHDMSTWTQVSKIPHWLGRTSRFGGLQREITTMKNIIFEQTSKVDQVFLGSDKLIKNQMLVELSGNTTYNRLEDGVWSYYCSDRHWASKLWHKAKIQFLRTVGGLHSNMTYNVGGLGHGKGATADYLYKPELLERVSPNPVGIDATLVAQAMAKLSGHPEGYQEHISDNSILFLGSMLVEYGKITIQEEMGILKHIYGICEENNIKLLYKPHPAETTKKMDLYKSEMPQLNICLIRDPIEILYNKFDAIRCVLAHSSSGLLFADVFSAGRVKPIGLYQLYTNQERDPVLNRLMQKSGVISPQNIDELKQYLVLSS